MQESELRRVKGGAAESGVVSARATVDGVADDRQPGTREVHPDLMGPPRLGSDLELCDPVRTIAPDYSPARRRRPSRARAHGHALAVAGMASDRAVDAAGALLGLAADEGAVEPLDRMQCELLGQAAVGEVGLGHHEDARGPAVETVHDARPQHPADSGELAAAVMKQGIHEGPARMAGRGVDDETRRLVHDHEVGVLEQDDERNRLRHERQLDRQRRPGLDHLTEGEHPARPHRPPRDMDPPELDPALHLGTRSTRPLGQDRVDPLADSFGVDRQLDR